MRNLLGTRYSELRNLLGTRYSVLGTRQPLVGRLVEVGGAGDDVWGEGGRRGVAIPAAGLQPVAHVLLVVAGLGVSLAPDRAGGRGAPTRLAPAAGLVVGPGGAGQVAAHHALDVDAARAADQHRPARQPGALLGGPVSGVEGKLGGVERDAVV